MLVRQPADEAQRALLRRIADGDHHALGELYDQLARVLFSTAVHILGDPREAEEVVQDDTRSVGYDQHKREHHCTGRRPASQWPG